MIGLRHFFHSKDYSDWLKTFFHSVDYFDWLETFFYSIDYPDWLETLFAMVGKFGITATFLCTIIFSAELFPTTLRYSPRYYRPQTKFAMVMFSQVLVCPQGALCPGGSLSRGSLSRGSMSRGVSVREISPCTVKSGRCTSYWNAFLFF